MAGSEKVHFSRETTVTDGDEDEEDYSASVNAIMLRRASTRRQSRRSRSRSRRPSSPYSLSGGFFSPDADSSTRRRSSVFTTSSGETAISVEEGLPSPTQEQIYENLRLHKEVLTGVRQQPWSMRRKLRLAQQAKAYVKRHEGELQERLAQGRTTKDMLAQGNIFLVKQWQYLKRESANLVTILTPWELRIKEIESHFGSVVASYFLFLRWLFWVNLVMSILVAAFIILPEVMIEDGDDGDERKKMLPDEKETSKQLSTLWAFEGVLKYSPIFYGYYSTRDGNHLYRMPLAYFLTSVAVYIYSFVATLRKMAANSRLSKMSEKEDECVFTWKLFTGWDYMIGNAETAQNRVSSIIMNLKESLLEEAEKKRTTRNWKIIVLRILVNIIVLLLLISSAYVVIQLVQRSTEPAASLSWWRQYETTIVVSLISFIFPYFFDYLGMLENYHPRTQLRIELARIMAANLLNLYTLIFALFDQISDMTKDLDNIRLNITRENATLPFLSEASSPMYSSSCACQLVAVSCSTVGSFQILAPSPPATTIAAAASILAATATVASGLIQSNFTHDLNFPEIPSALQKRNESSLYNRTLVETDFEENQIDSDFNINESISNYYDFENSSENSLYESEITTDIFGSNIINYTLEENITQSTLIDELSTNIEIEQSSISGISDTSESESPLIDKTPCYKIKYKTQNSLIPEVPLNRLDPEIRKKLKKLCWETMFGQELVKLTIVDLLFTIGLSLVMDFFRAIFVRFMNRCWCWDLERKYPKYGDFKIAESILQLVNNQGMVWMGMFFSPALPLLNVAKLGIIVYFRSWIVLTCNVPHEVVFRASRSNNFYFALLLMMLFLCVLPVSYAIVWVDPSWHCGPFSNYKRIYHLITHAIRELVPTKLHLVLEYIASPGIVIPLLVLLVLIIYYLVSLTAALREANNDLKIQLRKERTVERRKMFEMVDPKLRAASATPFARWRKLIPSLPRNSSDGASPDKDSGPLINTCTSVAEEKRGNGDIINKNEVDRNELITRLMKRAIRKSSATSEEESAVIADGDGTDADQPDSLSDDLKKVSRQLKHRRRERGDSVQSTWSENIPEIRISLTENESSTNGDKPVTPNPCSQKAEPQKPKANKYQPIQKKRVSVLTLAQVENPSFEDIPYSSPPPIKDNEKSNVKEPKASNESTKL